jgi:hypothetical protein
MADETQRFIATWADAMSLPQAPAMFHREVLVLEDGIEYWLPVQDVVADAMIRELEPGQAIEIFAVYAGQSLHDHVFLVNEFLTAGKPPAEGRRARASHRDLRGVCRTVSSRSRLSRQRVPDGRQAARRRPAPVSAHKPWRTGEEGMRPR